MITVQSMKIVIVVIIKDLIIINFLLQVSLMIKDSVGLNDSLNYPVLRYMKIINKYIWLREPKNFYKTN